MNMANMMQQMKKVQETMAKEQEAMEKAEYTAQDKNKLVKVVVNGNKKVLNLSIAPELVDPEDVAMLEDLVLATLNDAFQQVDQVMEQKMGKLTQGLNLKF